MKQIGFFGTGVVLLLYGITALAYAQHEQRGNDQGESRQEQKDQHGQQHQQPQQRPQQERQHQPQGQPAQHQAGQPAQRQERPQQTYGGAYHGGVKPNAPAYGGVHASGVPQHRTQVRNGFGQSRASSWDNDHRTWGQRGGYNGYRISQDRFNRYFGSDHHFRIYGLPLVFVGGYPRFQYDGYWVTFVDPWPERWPEGWYQTDDVYIDYRDDGYYVYNRSRPGPGVAVTISF